MRITFNFLKSTLVAGALVVLPVWLALLLFLKVLIHLDGLVKPLAKVLPPSISR